jgi:hypothetical protein
MRQMLNYCSVLLLLITFFVFSGCESGSKLNEGSVASPESDRAVEEVVEAVADADKSAQAEATPEEVKPEIFKLASENLKPHLSLVPGLEITDDIPVTSHVPFLSSDSVTLNNVTIVSMNPHQTGATVLPNGDIEFPGFDAVFKVIDPNLPAEVKMGDLTFSIYSGSVYITVTTTAGVGTFYVDDHQIAAVNSALVSDDLVALNTAIQNIVAGGAQPSTSPSVLGSPDPAATADPTASGSPMPHHAGGVSTLDISTLMATHIANVLTTHTLATGGGGAGFDPATAGVHTEPTSCTLTSSLPDFPFLSQIEFDMLTLAAGYEVHVTADGVSYLTFNGSLVTGQVTCPCGTVICCSGGRCNYDMSGYSYSTPDPDASGGVCNTSNYHYLNDGLTGLQLPAGLSVVGNKLFDASGPVNGDVDCDCGTQLCCHDGDCYQR